MDQDSEGLAGYSGPQMPATLWSLERGHLLYSIGTYFGISRTSYIPPIPFYGYFTIWLTSLEADLDIWYYGTRIGADEKCSSVAVFVGETMPCVLPVCAVCVVCTGLYGLGCLKSNGSVAPWFARGVFSLDNGGCLGFLLWVFSRHLFSGRCQREGSLLVKHIYTFSFTVVLLYCIEYSNFFFLFFLFIQHWSPGKKWSVNKILYFLSSAIFVYFSSSIICGISVGGWYDFLWCVFFL